MKTIDISCVGYAVVADVYESDDNGPILLSLIGRTSNRSKEHYRDFLPRLAEELGVTSVIFDYTGHGDSPFELGDLRPAQHFLEVVTVFDWMKAQYPNRKMFVIGSSYGGFLATQLTKYRTFDGLVLRAPAIYRPEDFYTPLKDIDLDTIRTFRTDEAALQKHPLLAQATEFAGDVLLVVHAQDELVPKQTTDAYAHIFRPDVLTPDVTHSLDNATSDQITAYNESIFEWLAKKVEAR